jgi:hypothetical protein
MLCFLHSFTDLLNGKIKSFGFIETASCEMCDVDNTTIYTVQFGDDQLVMAERKEDFEYVYM